MEDSKTAPIVGLFGISGSGKSRLLQLMSHSPYFQQFLLLEGSERIQSMFPGDLHTFNTLSKTEKYAWREATIRDIRKQSVQSGKPVVVTGHCSFWESSSSEVEHVMTAADLEIFTHIVYVNTPVETVEAYRRCDDTRKREPLTLGELRTWQDQEREELWQNCLRHDILVTSIGAQTDLVLVEMQARFEYLLGASEHKSALLALQAAVQHASEASPPWSTVLLIDGDRTLIQGDSGIEFWKELYENGCKTFGAEPLRCIFSKPSLYTYRRFVQAQLLYHEVMHLPAAQAALQKLSLTSIRPEFQCIEQLSQQHPHIGIIVLSCGPSVMWQTLLARHNLLRVAVLGLDDLLGGLVITPRIKGDIAAHLRWSGGLHVCAFGDSVLDVDMLKSAHRSVLVLDTNLEKGKDVASKLDGQAVRVEQLLCTQSGHSISALPSIPIMELTPSLFLDMSTTVRWSECWIDCTRQPAARLLMAPLRDATVRGSALRRAHRATGAFLSLQCLGDALGLEEYPIPHVQGHYTVGHRYRHEAKTAIVAIMRGGEPMAQGVSETMPHASLVHARTSEELSQMSHRVDDCRTIILVDSVVNTGASILDFIQHLRAQNMTTRLVVMTAVVQEKTWHDHSFRQAMKRCGVTIITLRVSENSYKGSGGTDTGNRLFNTAE